ncbi:MAG: AMP-dependent synthetase/ligase, partial [Bradyrhizobium sp.]
TRASLTPDVVSQRHKRLGIWRQFSCAEVANHVRSFAAGLLEMGMSRGETVAIIGENEPEHLWCQFAAQSAGGKSVSIYPDSTAAEIEYILTDSGAKYLLAQDQEQVDKVLPSLKQLPGIRSVIYWDAKGLWSYQHPLLLSFEAVQALGNSRLKEKPEELNGLIAQGSLDDVATLCYTSGTTGSPKGVILTHRYIFDNASRVFNCLDLKPGMECLSYIPLAWSLEQIIGVALGLVVPFVVNFPEGPDTVQSDIRELAVDVMVFSPRQWESLASTVEGRMLDAGFVRRFLYGRALSIGHAVSGAHLDGCVAPLWARLLHPLVDALVLRHVRENLGLTRSRAVLSGGTAMAPDVFRMFHALGVPLRNLYGTTEVGVLTLHRGECYDVETVGSFLSCDPAYGGPIEWKLASNDELFVRGGSGFAGYYGKAKATDEKIVDGWFATGDAVTVTANGELVFLERVSDMRMLADGHRYPPQYIETRLRFSPFIRDVMVLGDETRAFVAALVNIDGEMCGRWAEDRGISFSTFTDLAQKPEIHKLVCDALQRVNRLLPAGSRVARFANFPKNLDPDDGELTRSRKLKREFLEHRYSDMIEGLYAIGTDSVQLTVPVSYQGGTSGTLVARVPLLDVPDAGRIPGAEASIRQQRPRIHASLKV